jgi:hypothetical protein
MKIHQEATISYHDLAIRLEDIFRCLLAQEKLDANDRHAPHV